MTAKRLLIQHDTDVLSSALDRAYPPADTSDCFDEALNAIDEAEDQVWASGGSAGEQPE